MSLKRPIELVDFSSSGSSSPNFPANFDPHYHHHTNPSKLSISTAYNGPTSPISSRHTHNLSNNSPITCVLPPTCHSSPSIFYSLPEFESHYNNFHSIVCLECQKSFPSQHILNLHITEFHDPFSSLRKERGHNIYECFVDTCSHVSANPHERQQHAIQFHKFPQVSRFHINFIFF